MRTFDLKGPTWKPCGACPVPQQTMADLTLPPGEASRPGSTREQGCRRSAPARGADGPGCRAAARRLFHHKQCHLGIQMTFYLSRFPGEVKRESYPRIFHSREGERVLLILDSHVNVRQRNSQKVFGRELCFLPPMGKEPQTLAWRQSYFLHPLPLSSSKIIQLKSFFTLFRIQ